MRTCRRRIQQRNALLAAGSSRDRWDLGEALVFRGGEIDRVSAVPRHGCRSSAAPCERACAMRPDLPRAPRDAPTLMLQNVDERNRDLVVNINGRLLPRDDAGVSPFDSA